VLLEVYISFTATCNSWSTHGNSKVFAGRLPSSVPGISGRNVSSKFCVFSIQNRPVCIRHKLVAIVRYLRVSLQKKVSFRVRLFGLHKDQFLLLMSAVNRLKLVILMKVERGDILLL